MPQTLDLVPQTLQLTPHYFLDLETVHLSDTNNYSRYTPHISYNLLHTLQLNRTSQNSHLSQQTCYPLYVTLQSPLRIFYTSRDTPCSSYFAFFMRTPKLAFQTHFSHITPHSSNFTSHFSHTSLLIPHTSRCMSLTTHVM